MSEFGKCGGGGRRSAKRLTAPLMTIVTTLKESRSAVLVDVSATGACIRGEDLPGEGEELFVTIEGVIAFGDVAWASGDLRGIAFESALTAGNEVLLRTKVIQGGGLSPWMRAAMDDWTLGFAR